MDGEEFEQIDELYESIIREIKETQSRTKGKSAGKIVLMVLLILVMPIVGIPYLIYTLFKNKEE